jgi:hypothetical protein
MSTQCPTNCPSPKILYAPLPYYTTHLSGNWGCSWELRSLSNSLHKSEYSWSMLSNIPQIQVAELDALLHHGTSSHPNITCVCEIVLWIQVGEGRLLAPISTCCRNFTENALFEVLATFADHHCFLHFLTSSWWIKKRAVTSFLDV